MLHERGEIESIRIGVGRYYFRSKFKPDDVAVFEPSGLNTFFKIESYFFFIFHDRPVCIRQGCYRNGTVVRVRFFYGFVVYVSYRDRIKTGRLLGNAVLRAMQYRSDRKDDKE